MKEIISNIRIYIINNRYKLDLLQDIRLPSHVAYFHVAGHKCFSGYFLICHSVCMNGFNIKKVPTT